MIESLRNPKLVALRKLSQRKHRRNQARFMVEGLQLLTMATETKHTPLEVFFCPDCFGGDTAPALLAQWQAQNIPTHRISRPIMQKLSERDAPQGLIATFALLEQPLAALPSTISEPGLVIVVDRLQDPGNLGTIIRTADAVAASAVVMLQPSVDPFDPKTVRGSMGSIFNLPLIVTSKVAELIAALQQHGYRLTGADGYQGQLPWDREAEALAGSTALIVGNEARGLSPDLRPYLTRWVRLPLLGQAESLNVAVAAGVLMYQWIQNNQLTNN